MIVNKNTYKLLYRLIDSLKCYNIFYLYVTFFIFFIDKGY